MMNCNDTYIKRVIGVTRTFSWTITTNGEAQSLEGRDLTLMLVRPRGQMEPMEFTTAGNVVSFTWQGKAQKELGRYGLILYENYGKPNQLRVDIHKFLELIPWSDRQSGTYADLTETSTNLGSEEISGETVVVDNLTSTNPAFALSANMGRVLNEKILAHEGMVVIERSNTIDPAQLYNDIMAGKPVVLLEDGSYYPIIEYAVGTLIDSSHVVDYMAFADHYFDPVDGVDTVNYYKWWRIDGWSAGETALATTSQIPSAYNSTPQMDGVGAAGSSTDYARGDHRHPSDTTKQDKLTGYKVMSIDEGHILFDNGNITGVYKGWGDDPQHTLHWPQTNDYLTTTKGIENYLDYYNYYKKPQSGIPASDMASAVQTSLGKADAAAPQATTYTKSEVDALVGSGVTVDDALSATSENPVQNKVVTNALNGKQATIDDLSTIRSGAAAGATAYQKPGTGIPESDMASAVQTSLGKADSAYQKPDTGIPSSDMASAVQTSLGKADSAYQKPSGGIPESDMASAVQTILDSVSGKANRSEIPSASDTSPLMDGTAAAGLATAYARGDHRHPSDTAKQDVISDLSTIRSGAAAGATAVQPATLQSGLAAKQDVLTFDNVPTANSNNPVKSSGIKTALDAKQATINTVNVTVDNNTGTPSGSASVSGSTLSISFQNLKGATGAQGPQGIQGVQGPQGPQGPTGVSGDASSLAIIHGIDKTTSYTATDVCGADAAQTLLNEIEGGFYY